MNEATLKRLRWRARRGTRELDSLLGWWLDTRLADAGENQLQAFDALLDCQDPELWGWIMGHEPASRTEWQIIIYDIRAAHRL